MKDILYEKILPNVQKPARYIGNELNAVHKDWDKIPFKVALAYPDTYEIGMSNLGIAILYHILNDQKDVLAERVFAPWPDMEEQLQTSNLKLPTLESFKPLNEFDLLGFGIGHELTYTNIVTMLKLGGIPLWSKDRKDSDPLVMAGGPCTFNPEPVADFFDFFVIGEGEEVIVEIVSKLKNNRASSREDRIAELSKIPGVYAPNLKNLTKKRIVKDLSSTPYPLKPIIPYIDAVHDRAVVEIMRGCKWGCKFCQAGWTGRPVREKKMDKVVEIADNLLKNTGYEELSLISLSSSDYSKIDELAKTLARKYEKKRISISLPSMRTNTFSINLAKEISRVRPSGVTLAPEAGTQRLRDYIGKNMTEENIIEGVEAAFKQGISSIKLYFMLGLPTEIEEDVLAICDLSRKILQIGKKHTNRTKVVVNLATFVPKPHTPLQWEKQISIEETLEKQRLIKQNVKAKAIQVRWHQAESSFLEGVFTRGDRELAKVVEKAWQLGARLDAWYEHIKLDIWFRAFAECGIDPNEYLRERKLDEPLPWDFIDTGVIKEILIRESGKAKG
ncbi:MAG: TIGR03960 family B12-binding radical SAM protein [Candidatus Margulisbacteria bacterium]|nr:TIGR03960 family B12-binding radical SAM protein [Candidatus Margulisiibacteriota bacterium]